MSFSKCLTLRCLVKNYYRLLKKKLPQTHRPATIQTRFCSDRHVRYRADVLSSKTWSRSRPQVVFLEKLPSVVVIARGLAVPALGISRSLGSHKAGLWFSTQLEPFLAIASVLPARNSRRRPGDLASMSREWGSVSPWSWHIRPSLQQASSPFHSKYLQAVAAQRTAITALDI